MSGDPATENRAEPLASDQALRKALAATERPPRAGAACRPP